MTLALQELQPQSASSCRPHKQTDKHVVSIKSTGLIICTVFLLSVLIIGSMLDVELILGYSLGALQITLLSSQL